MLFSHLPRDYPAENSIYYGETLRISRIGLLCTYKGLKTDRKTATRELEALSTRAERLASLKLEAEAPIEAYSEKARAGLDLYTSEDKHAAYKALGATVLVSQDASTEITIGVLCSNTETPS